MSNFTFLKTKEWQTIYQDAAYAEHYVLSDPRSALFYGRRTVEVIVEWLYAYDPAFRRPYDDNLAALMTDSTFQREVPQGVRDKMHSIRKLGNNAVHDLRPIKPSEALAMIQMLFHICHWYGRTYTQGDPNAIPDQFEEAKLPPPPRDIVQRSREQLKALHQLNLQQDEELRRLRAENEQLKAERAHVATTKVVNEAIPDTYDYTRTEAETRTVLIDQLLREAGWHILSTPQNASFNETWAAKATSEYRVTPMPNRQGFGFADYVLWGADGLPLAVVEAKKASVDKERGKQQAKLYADALQQMHGQRPIIFYTNGHTVSLWDDEVYPPREVQGFYTADELQLLIQRRTTAHNLAEMTVNKNIADRYYQEAAIRHVTEHFSNRHRRALLVMATGTGKTRTAVALVDLLMRANWVKRVLFLADRTTLVRQAVKAFKAHLPASNPINLLEDKEARESRVVVSTYHTILNQIEEKDDSSGQRLFTPGHFDLIIIDEAHRSVYQKFGAIFAYFDSLLLGLTATPRDEIDRNTYRLFGLEEGVPNFAYQLDEAVGDSYLVPPVLLESDTKFLREGIHYDDLSDAEKEEWDRIEWDEAGSIPDAVESAALNNWLFNEDTVDKVLRTLMEQGHKVAGGDRLGKTIIFAKNHKHAEFIEQRFNHHYSQYKGKFARVIDNYVNYAQSLIDDFGKKEADPHIAISVDMLDTGVDVPEAVNLVFFKLVRSKTKFFQMIGRGTRLCPDLFGPGLDKEDFYIFDFCGNFEFFRYNPQGRPESRLVKPLRQRIFAARLELLAALDEHVGQKRAFALHEPLREQIADELHSYVAAMNLDNFIVRPQRPYVEPFQNKNRWQNLSKTDVADLQQHVAALPSQLADEPETAKRFDVLILNLQLAVLRGESQAIAPLRNRVVKTAVLLSEKGSIPAVQAQMSLIEQLQTDEYWQEITVPQLEDVRRRLRDLTQFIERQEQKVITTDFADEIGEIKPGYLPEISDGVNKAQYRKKVQQFIRAHEDTVVIHKIRWAIPLTPADLQTLDEILFSAAEIGSETEFARVFGTPNNLAELVRGLVGLDRQAAKQKFAVFLDGSTYNADQIEFVNYIIDHLTRNGMMDTNLLWERPFVDIHDGGPNGLFSEEDTTRLLGLVHEVNESVASL